MQLVTVRKAPSAVSAEVHSIGAHRPRVPTWSGVVLPDGAFLEIGVLDLDGEDPVVIHAMLLRPKFRWFLT